MEKAINKFFKVFTVAFIIATYWIDFSISLFEAIAAIRVLC